MCLILKEIFVRGIEQVGYDLAGFLLICLCVLAVLEIDLRALMLSYILGPF